MSALTMTFMAYFCKSTAMPCALQSVRNYLLRSLSADDEKLLRDVRKRCKSFADSSHWLASGS